jgi:thiosulfate/3-mercaptopyruvate sulfurtransferase
MIIPKRPPAYNKRNLLSLALPIMAFALLGPIPARSSEIPPIISPDWLLQNLGDSRMIVLDIRSPEQYKKGHIPGAINAPMSLWAVSNNGLSLELPSNDMLRDLIGKSGINTTSSVVVVNKVDTDFSRADPARVAWTLHVAGIENVGILDGGYNRWVREKKTISSVIENAKPGTYAGKVDRSSLATKADVLRKLDKATIVDSRVPEEYFGISLPSGHIKNAVDLPAPWMFESNGTFRKTEELEAMATGVLGSNKSREVIMYCGVGGYASAWWFVLKRVLGYRNVEVYDGSVEEWTKDSTAPMEAFAWH